MSDSEHHEHDEHGNCIIPEGEQPVTPSWQFSPWNVAGFALTTLGGVFSVLQQGANMAAQECWSHARWVANEREALMQAFAEDRARAEMSETLERMNGLDGHWLGDDAGPIS